MKHFSERQKYYHQLLDDYVNKLGDKKLNLDNKGVDSLEACFLGPKAENMDFFRKQLIDSFYANCIDRQEYHPEDPEYITQYRKDQKYENSLNDLEKYFNELLSHLRGSVPFFSYRYQAHMNWDLTMPGMLGYFAAMLYNQNNVAAEASPVTSQLEALVGDDLCKMLGYTIPDKDDKTSVRPWGHITCDGSIANLEAMWSSRNLKYYPISVAEALKNSSVLLKAKDISVEYAGKEYKLVDMNSWQLLNIKTEHILDLTQRITDNYNIDSDTLNSALEPYLLQSSGFVDFNNKYLNGIGAPIVAGTATKHYSWPKNAAALGIGKDNFINIPVDSKARMNYEKLKGILDNHLSAKQPIVMVVVVLGSTEQSAVDPLSKVLEIREDYRKQGIEFAIHVDSAWGGYFASLLRGKSEPVGFFVTNDKEKQVTPSIGMSDYVNKQYEVLQEADTITVDPHKAGYIPYPAGALCYKNKSMRNLIAFLAPEVYHGDYDANMGVFGIEGSKPGAAAAAVYMSHKVLRPDVTGYGKLLGKALFNSKRFFSSVITMADDSDPYVVVPVQQIPAEEEYRSTHKIIDKKELKSIVKDQLGFIDNEIVNKQNNEFIFDDDIMNFFCKLGSDQIIITYGLNFKISETQMNTNPELANQFMHDVFKRLSLTPDRDKVKETPLIITTSVFEPESYGDDFVSLYMDRLGLEGDTITMNFISSTTMDPWLSATKEGNYIPELIKEFKKVVYEEALKYQKIAAKVNV